MSGALPAVDAPGSAARLQSAFDAAGPGARSLLELTWVLFVGGAVIFVVVLALIAYALLARRERRGWLTGVSTIVVGGILFPVFTLSALLVYGLLVSRDLIAREENPLRIEVIGEQWWWRIRYLDERGIARFETANELRLPVDRAVELRMTSRDVIHSFWAPGLGGKLDLIPGHTNVKQVKADRLGVLRGQCAEYCGGPHALMSFYVVVHSADDFERWLQGQAAEARAPDTVHLEQGLALFMAAGCQVCHTIRGTGAMGSNGPDLTHVGSRLSIAAGNLPVHQGTLAGWIANPQTIKPGNHMPAFSHFLGAELRQLAAYLESLR